MHEFTGRAADRLADAYAEGTRGHVARRRAAQLEAGFVGADRLYDALFREPREDVQRETVFVRRKGRAGGGVVAAKIERDQAGSFWIRVRAHEQTAAELAEVAEQIEAILATEMGSASGVRLGRRLAASLSAREARDADRAWLEGCVWSAARASGLEWDRLRCAAVAEILGAQREGWERAVARVSGRRRRIVLSRAHDSAVSYGKINKNKQLCR